ncbi:MAG: class I SAM-dependent methyltransferase [Anaerolineales bacterium]|nr:class I SAM-dependent methyltransferase [Anaerolineales bacterium]
MDKVPDNLFPPALAAIQAETVALGFNMASEPQTGALLRALAASKPAGTLLELGTGTGLSAAWLLEGMDAKSTLLSVDTDPAAQAIAQRHLGHDGRLTLVCEDGAHWLRENQAARFDLIFADAWPGKFDEPEMALNLLKPGGIYFIDDLLPQANWPEGHAPKVPRLLEWLEAQPGYQTVRLAWASGLMLVVRTG